MTENNRDTGARVRRLEAVEAIRRLKCVYADGLDRFVNENGPAQPVLDCFSEAATWTSEHFGTYEGHAGLADLLDTFRSKVSLSLSFMLNHVVAVHPDGETAVGRWATWSPMTVGGEPLLLAGHYEDSYALLPSGWRITATELRAKFIVDYRKGWAEGRLADGWDWRGPRAGASHVA